MERVDKYYAAKAEAEHDQLGRLAAGFVVTIVINALVGYVDRATVIWQLFKWSTGLSENLQGLIQIAAAAFGLLLFGLLAEPLKSGSSEEFVGRFRLG